MIKKYKTDAIRYLFLPNIQELVAIHVIRTKRKTIELSCAPYLMEVYIKGPKELAADTVFDIVKKNVSNITQSILNYYKMKAKIR